MKAQPKDSLSQARTKLAHDRFELAAEADFCVKWLKSQGFKIIKVGKGVTDRPRIEIEPSPLCSKLEDITRGYWKSMDREYRFCMVYRYQCEVVWVDASTSSARTEGGQ